VITWSPGIRPDVICVRLWRSGRRGLRACWPARSPWRPTTKCRRPRLAGRPRPAPQDVLTIFRGRFPPAQRSRWRGGRRDEIQAHFDRRDVESGWSRLLRDDRWLCAGTGLYGRQLTERDPIRLRERHCNATAGAWSMMRIWDPSRCRLRDRPVGAQRSSPRRPRSARE